MDAKLPVLGRQRRRQGGVDAVEAPTGVSHGLTPATPTDTPAGFRAALTGSRRLRRAASSASRLWDRKRPVEARTTAPAATIPERIRNARRLMPASLRYAFGLLSPAQLRSQFSRAIATSAAAIAGSVSRIVAWARVFSPMTPTSPASPRDQHAPRTALSRGEPADRSDDDEPDEDPRDQEVLVIAPDEVDEPFRDPAGRDLDDLLGDRNDRRGAQVQ